MRSVPLKAYESTLQTTTGRSDDYVHCKPTSSRSHMHTKMWRVVNLLKFAPSIYYPETTICCCSCVLLRDYAARCWICKSYKLIQVGKVAEWWWGTLCLFFFPPAGARAQGEEPGGLGMDGWMDTGMEGGVCEGVLGWSRALPVPLNHCSSTALLSWANMQEAAGLGQRLSELRCGEMTERERVGEKRK